MKAHQPDHLTAKIAKNAKSCQLSTIWCKNANRAVEASMADLMDEPSARSRGVWLWQNQDTLERPPIDSLPGF
jgi:hypothetical protein